MAMNTPHTHPRTALIVEDNRLMLDLLEQVLSTAGFGTTTADHGQAAVGALMERHYDVLIVDVGLPDMNGMSIGDLARELYQNQIVIIVITGEQIHSRSLTSLGLYADDFLGKPFDTEELIARIESKLRRRDTQNQ